MFNVGISKTDVIAVPAMIRPASLAMNGCRFLCPSSDRLLSCRRQEPRCLLRGVARVPTSSCRKHVHHKRMATVFQPQSGGPQGLREVPQKLGASCYLPAP
jgi:hypothetical protein